MDTYIYSASALTGHHKPCPALLQAKVLHQKPKTGRSQNGRKPFSPGFDMQLCNYLKKYIPSSIVQTRRLAPPHSPSGAPPIHPGSYSGQPHSTQSRIPRLVPKLPPSLAPPGTPSGTPRHPFWHPWAPLLAPPCTPSGTPSGTPGYPMQATLTVELC